MIFIIVYLKLLFLFFLRQQSYKNVNKTTTERY